MVSRVKAKPRVFPTGRAFTRLLTDGALGHALGLSRIDVMKLYFKVLAKESGVVLRKYGFRRAFASF